MTTERLGQLALARGWIVQSDLDAALATQKQIGRAEPNRFRRVAHLLVKQGRLTPAQVVELLEEQGLALFRDESTGRHYNVWLNDPSESVLAPSDSKPMVRVPAHEATKVIVHGDLGRPPSMRTAVPVDRQYAPKGSLQSAPAPQEAPALSPRRPAPARPTTRRPAEDDASSVTSRPSRRRQPAASAPAPTSASAAMPWTSTPGESDGDEGLAPLSAMPPFGGAESVPVTDTDPPLDETLEYPLADSNNGGDPTINIRERHRRTAAEQADAGVDSLADEQLDVPLVPVPNAPPTLFGAGSQSDSDDHADEGIDPIADNPFIGAAPLGDDSADEEAEAAPVDDHDSMYADNPFADPPEVPDASPGTGVFPAGGMPDLVGPMASNDDAYPSPDDALMPDSQDLSDEDDDEEPFDPYALATPTPIGVGDPDEGSAFPMMADEPSAEVPDVSDSPAGSGPASHVMLQDEATDPIPASDPGFDVDPFDQSGIGAESLDAPPEAISWDASVPPPSAYPDPTAGQQYDVDEAPQPSGAMLGDSLPDGALSRNQGEVAAARAAMDSDGADEEDGVQSVPVDPDGSGAGSDATHGEDAWFDSLGESQQPEPTDPAFESGDNLDTAASLFPAHVPPPAGSRRVPPKPTRIVAKPAPTPELPPPPPVVDEDSDDDYEEEREVGVEEELGHLPFEVRDSDSQSLSEDLLPGDLPLPSDDDEESLP